MNIDTAKVSNRRTLRFETWDDVLNEAHRLAESERAGKLQQLGNWSLGRTLGHLGAWINYGFDGYPLKLPAIIPFLIRPFRRRILYKPMRAGSKIPKVPGGTIATEVLSLDEGLTCIEKAIDRAKHQSPIYPSPLFGRLNAEQFQALHLRHAELHLGFYKETVLDVGRNANQC
jgi:Protein of unknown function (DUF1569)